jgi:hypothetical protein
MTTPDRWPMFRARALAAADKSDDESKAIIRLLVLILDGYDAIERSAAPR